MYVKFRFSSFFISNIDIFITFVVNIPYSCSPMKTYRKFLSVMALALALPAVAEGPYYSDIKNPVQLKEFFKYSPDRAVLVSGHRGGMEAGYPENCIESFGHTLDMMPSFFEIDPRLTADSVIVLMHDKNIDRTTTGKGLVGQYTYDELLKFNLVDHKGDITPYKIPTLDDCIKWSQGKTVLNLDIKDVPVEVMARYIKERHPENLIYTVWNPEQMLQYCELDPNATFSIWCRSPKDYEAYTKANIPWNKVMVAYVGPSMKPEHEQMYRSLHGHGVMCMISVAPTHDRCYNDWCKTQGYKQELATPMRPDIVETDYPYLFVGLQK